MAIYKYVSADRIDILINSNIRFTQPTAFNDLFEMNPHFIAIANEGAIDDFLKSDFCGNENMEKLLKEAWEAECQKCGVSIPFRFVRYIMKGEADKFEPIMKDWFKQFMMMKGPNHRSFASNTIHSGIDKSFGILCLTEKPDNLLMWAHYSENHSGFVIEFNEKHNFFDQRKNERQTSYWLRKVRYAKIRPKIILFDLSKSDEQNQEQWINDFIWVKSEHWDYEQEWRMICGLRRCKEVKINNNKIYLHPIPIECITGIILGCRISDTNRNVLLRLLKSNKIYSHIRLLRAVMDEREYKLNFKEIT